MKTYKGIIGSVIGDIAGSSHESKPVKVKRFKLFNKNSRITDDTVLTMAVAEWMLDRSNVEISSSLIKWAELYPHAGFGSSFKRFLAKREYVHPGSTHNGAAMRVSAVGYLSSSLEECLELAKLSALPSHGSEEAIIAAQVTASAIYLARTGTIKEDITNYISSKFGYKLHRTYDKVREEVHHARAMRKKDYEYAHDRIISAKYTVEDALIAFMTGNSYKEVIRLAIYLGGDADTTAAIAGGIAAAYYGVPEEIIHEALIYIPSEMIHLINTVDGTDWQPTGLIPPKSTRWSVNDIVVYGSNADGTVTETPYYLTHKTIYNKHFIKGYPLNIIGNNLCKIKEEINTLREKCASGKYRWHLHETGIESGTLTLDQFRELFSWALELDNVLVCSTLKN